MKKDLEVIEALKNNDERRIEFFKNKIKEELTKNNMPISDDIINNYLEEGIKSYNENIKIPFLFYLKALIRKNKEKIRLIIMTKSLLIIFLLKKSLKY